MVITVHPRKNRTLRDLLLEMGHRLPGDCGGVGRCRRCQIKVKGRLVLACQYIPKTAIRVKIENEKSALPEFAPFPHKPGLTLACDIGTTTITLTSIDRHTKRRLRTATLLNPQARYGADVISRITQAHLVKKIRLSEHLKRFIKESGIDSRHRITAVGNTVMMHFLFDKNPSTLGIYPYRSRLPLGQVIEQGIDGLRIRTLPLLGPFIGSDCTSAIIASGIYQSKKPCLLIDAGTNGEIILGNCERLLVCSTAAGPAFEGATLECGSLFQPGAITAANYQAGRWRLKTGRNLKPRSLCGSGVLDVVAASLDAGLILPSGRIRNGNRVTIYHDEKLEVYLSQSDLRQIQLAKAAIAAGIGILMKRWFGSDRPVDWKISRLIITGRFGHRINPRSAFTIGLLPAIPSSALRQHSNLALAGAVRVGIDDGLLPLSEEIARRCTEVVLSQQEEFEPFFIKAMELKKWE